MLMDCPRCGFNQPKDRFCAKCGVDVETFRPKPKPILKRLGENTGLHIVFAGLLLTLAISYILYSRVDVVSREVGHLLGGAPLSSREAADPSAPPAPAPPAAAKPEPLATAPADTVAEDEDEAVDTTTPGTASAAAAAAGAAANDPQHLEINFFEINHEQLGPVVGLGEHNGQGDEGRAFYFKDATKLFELTKPLRHLGASRSAALQTGAQAMIVTPPTTPEPFQFGLAVQVVRFENHEAQLQWNSQLVLTAPEAAAENAPVQPASLQTTPHAPVGSSMTGNLSLRAPNEALVIVIEPSHRHPRDEFVLKAGEGPWSIFGSEEFRAGTTDWVAVVRLK